jgi:hypothetical protein
MASRKPRKSESASHRGSISDHASDWIRRFSKELEDNFIDAAVSIPADAAARDYQDATIRAVFSVLLDSGMDAESFAETVGRVLIEKRTASVEWTSEFNQRRFELIDKEIQETLTPAERIELAGLTRIMRERLESEADLPMEGARALHRKLLGLDAEDKPR